MPRRIGFLFSIIEQRRRIGHGAPLPMAKGYIAGRQQRTIGETPAVAQRLVATANGGTDIAQRTSSNSYPKTPSKSYRNRRGGTTLIGAAECGKALEAAAFATGKGHRARSRSAAEPVRASSIRWRGGSEQRCEGAARHRCRRIFSNLRRRQCPPDDVRRVGELAPKAARRNCRTLCILLTAKHGASDPSQRIPHPFRSTGFIT
jgi:hypothetical protein